MNDCKNILKRIFVLLLTVVLVMSSMDMTVFAREIIHINGADRYDTSFQIADNYKDILGVDKFESVIVASGENIPIVLAGSYLAAVENAPILLTNNKEDNVAALHDYIKANVQAGGTVYILGNTFDVSSGLAEELGDIGYSTVRLYGNTRYDTNVAILAETGVTGGKIIVASGEDEDVGYGLSAAALGLPILLVRDALTEGQKACLDQLNALNGAELYIVGPEFAVSKEIEESLGDYGTVERIAGVDEITTSSMVASRFFDNPTSAVISCSGCFGEGACGAVLAAALKAPLLLIEGVEDEEIPAYVEELGLNKAYIVAMGNHSHIKAPQQANASVVTDSSITLSWTASSSEGVVKYEVFDWYTKEILAEVAETEVELTGLEADTEYKIAVCAVDADGNKSDPLIFTETTLKPEQPEAPEIVRLFGSSRYVTSYQVADAYKKELGVDKFDAVIVATGKNFADALSGSYLAAVKNAPILLTNSKEDNVAALQDYIKANVQAKGTVYILGNTSDVSADLDGKLAAAGYTVERLAGATRYETNLQILNETNVTGEEIIVATGEDFGYGLSAAALGLPILLVEDALTADQKAYLDTLKGAKFCIVGPEFTVSEEIEESLKDYGTVTRIAGADRTETSFMVASRFFENPTSVVITSSLNFHDGLGGPVLAAALNAPVLVMKDITDDGVTAYAEELGLNKVYILGGVTQYNMDGLSSPKPPQQAKAGVVTDSSITLSWTASPSEDVVKYEVFDWNTEEMFAEVTETEVELTGLEADTKYKIAICAVGANKHKSDPLLFTETTLKPEAPEIQGVDRIFGAGRIDTGFAVADTYKDVLGVKQFEAMIIATGSTFADALPGSYLAYAKSAPILLTSNARIDDVVTYVKENLKAGGKIYILGGTAAVPESLERKLSGYNVHRLAGTNRYDTNLMILEAAEVTGGEIIIATGKNFADSLSASAVKKPILMVKNALTAEQKEYLKTLNIEKFYIIGGTAAVSDSVKAELSAYGTCERIAGKNRRETSVEVAKKFFENPKAVVVASASNFPDGLCGGPLAASLDAPMILTVNGKTSEAADYVEANAIDAGYVLGGTSALLDDSLEGVFNLN